VIQGNTITGALYNAIELSFCQDNKIVGNHISNSLDGIWLGFAMKNEINGGNELRDLGNHGIISWNSRQNNVSSNTIVNSREALYFYSSDYDRQQFFFVQGEPSDHVSTENCLCDNTLLNNAVAAIHLNNSIKNQITDNRLTNNGTNFVMEGNTAGNIIQDNVIQGGSYNINAPTTQRVAFSTKPNALTAYAWDGRVLARAEVLRAIWSDAPGEPFDLRWFKYKLRISLGLP
jgi:parallel beta-helix repeat protein